MPFTSKKVFIAVGHIVNDEEPYDHLGGGVSYSAIAASRLGYPAHIITKCPKDHPYIADLKRMGVTVHVLPSSLSTITSFRNTYDKRGRRKQQVTQVQEHITAKDFPAFPKEILSQATILIAPVVGEVSMDLYPLLAQYGTVAVTPQGYFRHIDARGTVTQKKWSGFSEGLQYAKITVLSDEDMTLGGEIDIETLNAITSVCQIVVLTKGSLGADLYEDGKITLHAGSYKLEDNEIVDFTGAGDTYATAFIMEISKGLSIHQATTSAAFFAALKIQGITGIGIDSIPTQNLIRKYISEHKDRTQEFVAQEKLATLIF